MDQLITIRAKLSHLVRNHWKKISILLFLGLVIAGILWRRNSNSQEVLTFEHPQIRSIRQELNVSGLVDAKERVRLRFLAGGKLTYVGAQEGDQIKKWQTIATIDQATLQKQLEQDLNNYMKERWDWEQTRDDYVENGFGDAQSVPELTTRREIDKAQWDLTNQVLNVEIRDIAIKNTRLTSPISGILTTAPAAVAGMQLLATDYYEIVNPDTFVFKAAVDEVDIKNVALGQLAEIELDAFPDDLIQTQVEYVAFSSSQASTGTVFVIELPLSQLTFDQVIRLGMNGDATIILAEKPDVLTIPIDATRERDGKILVDVQTGPQAYEEREVKTGIESADYIEVTGGLTENDAVLIPT